jgi:hypothetical protein
MSTLPAYNPVKSVRIPGVDQACPLKGLVVVIGPNSSGKTLFLRDILLALQGNLREQVVCTEIQLERPEDLDAFVRTLQADGSVRLSNQGGHDTVQVVMPLVGTANLGGGGGTLPLERVWPYYQEFAGSPNFMQTFGPLCATVLFIPDRLEMVKPSQGFDHKTNPPATNLQALYLNPDAQLALERETGAVFNNAAFLDSTRLTSLELKVSHSRTAPSGPLRTSPQKMADYDSIALEGDGYKSYVGTCIPLLLGRRPICLIDEPEMYLHPPHAHRLGRFIGKYGASADHAVLVATHSSHILRGIIESAAVDVTIVRLSRRGKAFWGRVVDNPTLRTAVRKPITRAEAVLDGMFSEAVTIVESDGDRGVYQAAWEKVEGEFGEMLQFVGSGGLGGIGDIYALYKSLDLPVTVIADLDVILDKDKLKTLTQQMTSRSQASQILALCQEAAREIKALAPTVGEAAVKAELQELANRELPWEGGDEDRLFASLRQLARSVDKMKRLKRGGVGAYCSWHDNLH